MDNQKSQQTCFSVVCIGLDNSGKTTICRNLSDSKRHEILPTPNMEIHYVNIQKLNQQCLIYDLSGNGRHRGNWQLFYAEVQGILYVVDASDSEDRYKIQSFFIDEILNNPDVIDRGLPFVVMLNKQDKQNTFTKDELVKALGLDVKKGKGKLIIKETSGFTGQGLKETIDALADAILIKKA